MRVFVKLGLCSPQRLVGLRKQRYDGAHSFTSSSKLCRHAQGGRQNRSKFRSRPRLSVQSIASSSSAQKATLYPAGAKQARVKLPALVIKVTAGEVLAGGTATQAVADAVSGGATAVLLTESDGAGGAELYEAAVALKELLRGRAALLVQDRTDIVDAAGADGVVLSRKGVPTVVARRMMQGAAALVGRAVFTPAEARIAAADGANLILLEAPTADEVRQAREQQSGSPIPVVASFPGSFPSAEAAAAFLAAGVDGLAVGQASLGSAAVCFSGTSYGDAVRQAEAVCAALGAAPAGGGVVDFAEEEERGERERGGPPASALKLLLNAPREDLLEAERGLMSDVLALLEEVTPQMEEIGLLRDAIKQLDELFLLVVVGEFNSGKSSVINALLGGRFLAEGILPTTNEISVLKHSETGQEEVVQGADGLFTRYLPAELLREINVVDTPGTNVILDRQQRLTEEYVPRADLVLFVLSADRPFTESEVGFLRYIRQWGKKVVFVVNKVDILSDAAEVDEVTSFVAANAERLLGVQTAQVLPVSARMALQAKVAAGHSGSGGVLHSAEDLELAGDERWGRSCFGNLERFIFDFLMGGPSSGERVRLKLQTPLFVADALLEAAGRQLDSELNTALEEEAAVQMVSAQMDSFRAEMIKDGAAQRSEARRLVAAQVARAKAVVDSTLQLSNVSTLRSYLLGSGAPEKLPVQRELDDQVMRDAAIQLRGIATEHSTWLRSNCESQIINYRSFAEERAAQLGTSLEELLRDPATGTDADADSRRAWRQAHLAPAPSGKNGSAAESDSVALASVERFEPRDVAVMVEEEVREAVVTTAGAAAGAGGLGLFLTSVLPNTLEDLLALAVSGLAGYVAVLNLPLRRAETKKKIEARFNSFLKAMEEAMQAELEEGLAVAGGEVDAFMRPVAALAAREVARVREAEARRAAMAERLEQLKQRAASVE